VRNSMAQQDLQTMTAEKAGIVNKRLKAEKSLVSDALVPAWSS